MPGEDHKRSGPDIKRRRSRDWLEVLCLGLERLGVHVVACRACAGDGLIVLGDLSDDAQRPFEINFTRASAEPAHHVVSGLAIQYRGADVLQPEQKHALQVVSRLLEKLSPQIPQDLDSSWVIGRDHFPPHQALAFAYPFCTAERSASPDGPEIQEVLVRVTSRCNQACPFCSAPPELVGGDPSPEVIERLIRDIDAKAPHATCTLTGGEPTLRRDLPELVRIAQESPGARLKVKIQTNAVRFENHELLDPLGSSPRLTFFVSYHASDERKYDLCTGTSGMLGRARKGIVNLLGSGHHVVLSIVANAVNATDLSDWVDDVVDRFASLGSLSVHFSTTLCPAHRPEAEEWIIDYEQLAPRLERAYERAMALGLESEPLLSSTHAAIPACFLSPSHRSRKGSGVVIEPRVGQGGDGRGDRTGWVKPSRCDKCLYSSSCVGVSMAYANRFGLDALRPIL